MSNMVRNNFYLTKDQKMFLKKQKELTVSEHIRRAIDEYIVKVQNRNASTSSSLPKGEQNGK